MCKSKHSESAKAVCLGQAGQPSGTRAAGQGELGPPLKDVREVSQQATGQKSIALRASLILNAANLEHKTFLRIFKSYA